MIFPDIDPQEWARRYNIRFIKRKCSKCNRLFLSDIPIALKGYRGLQTPLHECGKEFQRMTLVPYGKKNKKKWDQILLG